MLLACHIAVSYTHLRVAAPRSEAEKNQLSIWSEMSPDMDYYFIAGQNLDEVISGYRTPVSYTHLVVTRTAWLIIRLTLRNSQLFRLVMCVQSHRM